MLRESFLSNKRKRWWSTLSVVTIKIVCRANTKRTNANTTSTNDSTNQCTFASWLQLSVPRFAKCDQPAKQPTNPSEASALDDDRDSARAVLINKPVNRGTFYILQVIDIRQFGRRWRLLRSKSSWALLSLVSHTHLVSGIQQLSPSSLTLFPRIFVSPTRIQFHSVSGTDSLSTVGGIDVGLAIDLSVFPVWKQLCKVAVTFAHTSASSFRGGHFTFDSSDQHHQASPMWL